MKKGGYPTINLPGAKYEHVKIPETKTLNVLKRIEIPAQTKTVENISNSSMFTNLLTSIPTKPKNGKKIKFIVRFIVLKIEIFYIYSYTRTICTVARSILD